MEAETVRAIHSTLLVALLLALAPFAAAGHHGDDGDRPSGDPDDHRERGDEERDEDHRDGNEGPRECGEAGDGSGGENASEDNSTREGEGRDACREDDREERPDWTPGQPPEFPGNGTFPADPGQHYPDEGCDQSAERASQVPPWVRLPYEDCDADAS